MGPDSVMVLLSVSAFSAVSNHMQQRVSDKELSEVRISDDTVLSSP